ncbi:hypothetical protein [Hymenobacter profundi]|uniref:Uncharacterized protein n=1 Tax=Hymenobacter profundi TaxID=1982110 RepID=A0ABS6X2T0_9BACT|nr:hypothetical protein [Hymenobacter profundi]MBW3130149.1 hypothetical protein [Hymenobacter profundi]
MIRFSAVIWLLLAGVIGIFIFFFFGFDSLYTGNRTIEIKDVSRIHVYKFEHKDISSPVNVRLKVEGEIDGNALIYVTEKEPTKAGLLDKSRACSRSDTITYFNINRGEVSKPKMFFDYYQNAPGYICYVPCGVKKGKLNIVWDM